ISPSGILAIAYKNYSHIRLYHSNGRMLKILSVFSKKDHEIESPSSIALDSQNRLMVVNQNSELYLLSDEKDNTIKQEIKYTMEKDFNISLRGIVSGTEGKIYISDTANDRLIVFPEEKSYKFKTINIYNLAQSGKELGELNRPTQLSFIEGNIYIIDKENHRVVKISEKGVLRNTYLIQDFSHKLLSPQDITVTPEGEIFVLAENKILKFDSDGKLVDEIAIEKGDNTYIGYAKGIAYDNGILYVADTYNHRILRYDETGVSKIGKIGGNLGDFFYPWDLIVHNNMLYIVDKGNHRVVLYKYETKSKNKKDEKDKSAFLKVKQ
ncbi:MAG: NHL repeat-containing protein, partial [Spirochaetota bacterium]|nr:NHL repeat-containing protein [Spirochaetota bacterium]